jgi:hypothetical protein
MMAALLWARLIFLSALAGIVGLCVWTAYQTNERERARGQTRQKGVNSQFSTPNSQRAQNVFFRTRTNEGRER